MLLCVSNKSCINALNCANVCLSLFWTKHVHTENKIGEKTHNKHRPDFYLSLAHLSGNLPTKCGEKGLYCDDGCLPQIWICDRIPDCSANEDESKALCGKTTVSSNHVNAPMQ